VLRDRRSAGAVPLSGQPFGRIGTALPPAQRFGRVGAALLPAERFGRVGAALLPAQRFGYGDSDGTGLARLDHAAIIAAVPLPGQRILPLPEPAHRTDQNEADQADAVDETARQHRAESPAAVEPQAARPDGAVASNPAVCGRRSAVGGRRSGARLSVRRRGGRGTVRCGLPRAGYRVRSCVWWPS
jgi:hypothetical protein